MEFVYEEPIPGPPDRALAMLRDRLTDLVAYLPAIDKIDELERQVEEDGNVRIVNLWQGNRKLVPTLAKPFVTKVMMTWEDHAYWLSEKREVVWRFEPMRFKRLFTCEGRNYLIEAEDGNSVLRMTGDLNVYPETVPGISARMAKRLKPKIAPWAIERIKPNLMQVPRALQAFFEEEHRATAERSY